MKKLNKSGFSHVEALIVVVVLAVIGAVGYYVWQRSGNPTSQAETNIVTTVLENDLAFDPGLVDRSKLVQDTYKGRRVYPLASNSAFNLSKTTGGKPFFISQPFTLKKDLYVCAQVKTITKDSKLSLELRDSSGNLITPNSGNTVKSNPAIRGYTPTHPGSGYACHPQNLPNVPDAGVAGTRLYIQVVDGAVRLLDVYVTNRALR